MIEQGGNATVSGMRDEGGAVSEYKNLERIKQ